MTRISFSRSPRLALVAAVSAVALALGGCASNYGGNTVSASGVGYASTVRPGVVEAVREVKITKEQSILGSVTGAVLGGIAGSELGGGDKAQTAGAIGGAVLGGIAGNEAGKALGTSKGFAYMVRFDDGTVKEIVQGADILIQPGTRVNVTFGQDRVRVAPASGVIVSQR
jgi:outer membrane lipoprotein SlyB